MILMSLAFYGPVKAKFLNFLWSDIYPHELSILCHYYAFKLMHPTITVCILYAHFTNFTKNFEQNLCLQNIATSSQAPICASSKADKLTS